MAKDMTAAIVPAGTELPNQRDVTVLHTYDNGDRLVQTPTKTMAAIESARMVQPPPATASTESTSSGVDTLVDGDQTYAVVELAGPPEGSVVDRLEATGVELVTFEPPASYLVRGAKVTLEEVSALPVVLKVSLPSAGGKPRILMPESGTREIWIVLYATTAEITLPVLQQMADLTLVDDLEPPAGLYRRIAAVADGGDVDAALALPGVAAVEDRVPAKPEDEVAGLILAGMMDSQRRPVGNYLRWLEDYGIDGAGVTIGIVDDGVDETHDAFVGRILSHDGNRSQWHGTFVAGHAAGDFRDERDPSGFLYGVGMAPGADLITQFNDDSAAHNCRRTVTTAGASGGANGSVQNNSWGKGTSPSGMDYGSEEATFDGLVRDADGRDHGLTVCFSAGNSGSDGLTRPKAAKNVIVTGNSESYRPEFRVDKPTAAAEADNPDEMFTGHGASSHGNCLDGRIRPHVCAPGEWTSAANFGKEAGSPVFISKQMTWGGGTSGASPKTAGACALAIDWWADNIGGEAPSPAMLRALLVNGATDIGFGGPIPNNRQGWGRVNLGAVFDESVHKLYVDQSIRLSSIGDERRWNLYVSDPGKPVKVTLTWTDPPGVVGSGTAHRPAIVNRLRLQIDHGGRKYYGNDFTNGWSRSGSPAGDEGTDNTQNVFLTGGEVTGEFTVTVAALQLAMNCLTNRPTGPQQDFALVVHNAHLNTGVTPVDTTVLVDENSGLTGDDNHWDNNDDDGSNDRDDTWGDGSQRRTLRRGDGGSDVRELQQLLNDLDYDTNGVDGDFGSGTQSAVRQFQRDQGLGPDGIVGTGTWEALERATSRAGTGGGPEPTDPAGGGTGGGTSEPTGSGINVSNRPTLRRGDRGSDVRELQQLLNDLGYDTNGIDSQFGGGTLSAVRRFQTDENLGADGVAGAMTWQRLDARANTEFGNDGNIGNDDWGDWLESEPSTENEVDGEIPPVAAELSAALAEETGAAAAGEAGDVEPLVGPLQTRLAELANAWATPSNDQGTIRARSAIVVVGRGSRFSRPDLVVLRRLGRLGTLFLLSDDQQVLGWLAQRLQVGRGIHYRLTNGPGGAVGAARDVVAEANGRHRAILAVRTNDDGTAVAARLDLTELDQNAMVLVRCAEPTLQLTYPDGKSAALTTRSRAKGLQLSLLDDQIMRLTLDGSVRPLAGTWVIQAQPTGVAVPTFEATIGGQPPATMRVDGRAADDGRPATESSGTDHRVVTVAATNGSLLQTRIRAVTLSESSTENLDLRPIIGPLSQLGESTPTTESTSVSVATAPTLSGVLPPPSFPGVTEVVVESRGITSEGYRFQRSQHDDLVSVMSRSEYRLARAQRPNAWDLVRGIVREVQYDRTGRVVALSVKTASERRVLKVQDPALRGALSDLDLGHGEYLFGVDGEVIESVVDPFEDAR